MNNFYVIYGEDKSVINNEVNKIIKKLEINDIVKYDMNDTLISDVVVDASYGSLFSNKKVMILDNCSFLVSKKVDGLEKLESYIGNYNKDCYFIFLCYSSKLDNRKKIVGLLNKNASIIATLKGDNNYLSNYVKEIINTNGYKLEDISYLLSHTGNNLDNIKNELDKLMVYKSDDKYITNKDIDLIVVGSMEDEIFSLTEAIVKRDISSSLNYLNEFLNRGYDEIGIISLIANQFRFMFQVKRLVNKGYDNNNIAKSLEANPYRVKFTVKKLYYYTEDMLINYLKNLYELDRDIKMGKVNKKLGLEMFIVGNETTF